MFRSVVFPESSNFLAKWVCPFCEKEHEEFYWESRVCILRTCSTEPQKFRYFRVVFDDVECLACPDCGTKIKVFAAVRTKKEFLKF